MPLANKPTSLQAFTTALDAVTTNQHATVKVTSEPVTITVSDPNGTDHAYSYNRRRYTTSEAEAVLYTVERPGWSHEYPVVLQALFLKDSGRFVSGVTSVHRSPAGPSTVASNSKRKVSQPFGWRGNSLTEVLKALENYTSEAIDLVAETNATRARRAAEAEAKAAQEKYQRDLHAMLTCRAQACFTLGDAATNEVLDYFLPLPTQP